MVNSNTMNEGLQNERAGVSGPEDPQSRIETAGKIAEDKAWYLLNETRKRLGQYAKTDEGRKLIEVGKGQLIKFIEQKFKFIIPPILVDNLPAIVDFAKFLFKPERQQSPQPVSVSA